MNFVYLLFLFFLSADSSCPKVKCEDSLPIGTCYVYKSSDDSIRVQECEEGEVCSVNQMYSTLQLNLASNNAQCVDQYTIPDLKVPGEICNKDDECKSSKCVYSKCKGKQTGESCESSEDCEVGLMCSGEKNKFCKRQVKERGNCTSSEECVNSAACFNGECTRYLSLENGAQYFDSNYAVSLLCKSGYLDASRACADAPYNDNDANEPCESHLDCRLKFERSDERKYGTCSCGLNSEGKAFCRAVQGDKEFKDFKQSLLEIIELNQGCHTSISFSARCPELSDRPEMNRFYTTYYTYLYRHLLIGQPKCVTDTITPFASEISISIADEDEETTSTLMVIIIVIVFAVIVIIGIVCFFCIKRIINSQSPVDIEDLNYDDDNRNFRIIISRVLFNFPDIRDYGKFKFDDLKQDDKNDLFLVTGIPVSEKVRYDNFEAVEDSIEVGEADIEGGVLSEEDKFIEMGFSPSSLFDRRSLDKTAEIKHSALVCEDY